MQSANKHTENYKKISKCEQIIIFLHELLFANYDNLIYNILTLLIILLLSLMPLSYSSISLITLVLLLVLFLFGFIKSSKNSHNAEHNMKNIYLISGITMGILLLIYFDKNFLYELIFLFYLLYVSLEIFRIAFYSILIPFALQQTIYINFYHNNIFFSQHSLLNHFQEKSVALASICNNVNPEKENEQEEEKYKHLITMYTYFFHIGMSRKTPKKYTNVFILGGIYFILGFFVFLNFELFLVNTYMSEVNISNELKFTIGNIPIIAYSYYTFWMILNKQNFYKNNILSGKELYNKISNDAFEYTINKYLLIDYKINDSRIPSKDIANEDKYEINLMLQIIIAIYITISIPLVYDRVYNTTIDIPKTMQTVLSDENKLFKGYIQK